MLDVNSVKINPSYRSDHSLVFLELKTEGRKCDKQYWKFNNSLLEVKTYIFMIKQLILNIKKQYAVPVYNLENTEYIKDELNEFQINDQLLFEVLLMETRGKTICSATYKKKEEAKTEKRTRRENLINGSGSET